MKLQPGDTTNLIHYLLDVPAFANRVLPLDPELFKKLEEKYIVAIIGKYFEEFKTAPTREIVKREATKGWTVEDEQFEELLKLLDGAIDHPSISYWHKHFDAWALHQEYARLYSPAVLEAFNAGNYQKIDDIVKKTVVAENEEEKGEDITTILTSKEESIDWLIQDILEKNKPAITGGHPKAGKTCMSLEGVFALATGSPYLNHFPVVRTRVLYFSGESGQSQIRQAAEAFQKTRKTTFAKDWLKFFYKLPKLSKDKELALLTKRIKDFGAGYVEIDPIYLCLTAGSTDLQASNLFDMGPVLYNVNAAVAEAGATLSLCHHFKRSGAQGIPVLTDLAYSGPAEYARQWRLIKRTKEYEEGNPAQIQQLLLVTGGAGRGTKYAINFREDTWHIICAEAKGDNKKDLKAAKVELDIFCDTIIDLAGKDERISQARIAEVMQISPGKAKTLIEKATEMGLAEWYAVKDEGKRAYRYVRPR